MKVAYTGWTWLVNHQDNHKWEFEQFLKEVSDLGYEGWRTSLYQEVLR